MSYDAQQACVLQEMCVQCLAHCVSEEYFFLIQQSFKPYVPMFFTYELYHENNRIYWDIYMGPLGCGVEGGKLYLTAFIYNSPL